MNSKDLNNENYCVKEKVGFILLFLYNCNIGRLINCDVLKNLNDSKFLLFCETFESLQYLPQNEKKHCLKVLIFYLFACGIALKSLEK